MARYISRASNFKKTVIKGEQTLIQGPAGPQLSVLREAVIAHFEQGNVTPWEVEMAADVWGPSFRGVAEGEAPLKRISGYDTDEAAERYGWDAATKAQVERLLDGQQGSDYMRVDMPKLSAPWPTYDTLEDSEDVLVIAKATGVNVDDVLAYERENLNRKDVVDGLEKIKAEVEDAVAEEDLVTA